MDPLEVHVDATRDHYKLPESLRRIYGDIGFGSPVLYANFVQSLDGVVSIRSNPNSGSLLSGEEPADRFVMGLLRCCAEGILVGGGTLRATPLERLTAAAIYPQMTRAFADLRAELGLSAEPRLIVVTASGNMDLGHPALEGALVLTSRETAKRIAPHLQSTTEVVALTDNGPMEMGPALRAARDRGLNVVLSEAGPSVMGQLVGQGFIDELFLTVSPVIAGSAGNDRLGLGGAAEFLPAVRVRLALLSLRSSGDYLFQRYRFASESL